MDTQPTRRRFLLGAGAAATAFVAACRQAQHHAQGATASPAAAPSPRPPTSTTTAPTPSGPARFVKSGPAASGAVALTFHGSGDLALTQSLLDKARALSVPITIFAVGNWLDANPDMAGRILADGRNELANHTYTHPALGTVARAGVATEITKCRDALSRHARTPGAWFRPSGIDTPTEVILEEAGRAGYPTVVGYDVDPLDYQDPGASAVAARVKAKLHGGAVISLHTGHAGTVQAFEPIVSSIKAAGLRPVTVGELLGAR
ncbi:MAG TPA: polysaccharide deacetylase family protein [Acidimicrobiales bacterium]|nr:polysaccharide deacetylase family protein [Acidimicrobiales bacterium]